LTPRYITPPHYFQPPPRRHIITALTLLKLLMIAGQARAKTDWREIIIAIIDIRSAAASY
jgi:hypothetical protein